LLYEQNSTATAKWHSFKRPIYDYLRIFANTAILGAFSQELPHLGRT